MILKHNGLYYQKERKEIKLDPDAKDLNRCSRTKKESRGRKEF